MLQLLHWTMELIYIAGPIWMLAFALSRGGNARADRLIKFIASMIVGAALGTALTLIQQRQANGRASVGQFALAIYFAGGMVFILKGLDALMQRLLRNRRGPTSPWMHLIRVVVLVVLGLPFILSGILVYRPKIRTQATPMTELDLPYSEVQFQSTDGLNLSGWWIPANPGIRRRPVTDDFGTKTVLICHGLGGNKSTELVLARRLIPAGYNALAFDFRAHGESDGQITTLGDLERRDVLGAVEWLQSQHPNESQKIFGVGASTGAAALIAAAADHSAQGQAIQAIAVYGAYDDLRSLADDMTRQSMLPPMNRITSRFGLFMASVNTGADLAAFKPAVLVHDLWPRPILVIHGIFDSTIPFEHGQALFDAASYPRQRLWLRDGDEGAEQNNSAADAVRVFFDTAQPMPAI